jgi:drug/metabolite transporter (DMT)-like permease
MGENTKRWILFIFLAIAWGSSFLIMKRGLRSFDYIQIGSLRIAFAWLLATVIALRSFGKLRKQHLLPLIGVGILGNGLPYYLFPLAITKLDSGLVGVFNSMVPLFTLIIGAVFFTTSFLRKQLFGVIVGFSGAMILLQPTTNPEQNIWYAGFAIIASICYAFSVNIIGNKLKEMPSIAITSLSLLFVGPPALIYVFAGTNFIEVMQTDPLAYENLAYIAVLGMVNSALAIIIFNQLIKNSSPLFASSVTYLIPIVALLWGVWDGETINILHLAGMATILLGVWLVNGKKRKKRATTYA